MGRCGKGDSERGDLRSATMATQGEHKMTIREMKGGASGLS
jgi:hypothetical protein